MLDQKDYATHNEPIEDNDIVQLGDLVVDKVGFKDVESAFMTITLKRCLEQRPIDVTTLIENVRKLSKE